MLLRRLRTKYPNARLGHLRSVSENFVHLQPALWPTPSPLLTARVCWNVSGSIVTLSALSSRNIRRTGGRDFVQDCVSSAVLLVVVPVFDLFELLRYRSAWKAMFWSVFHDVNC